MAQTVDPPRKILIVCQHFWPEAFRINDICDYLVDRNCSIDVLCGLPNYPSGVFSDGYSYFKPRRQEHNGAQIYRTFEIPRGNNSNLRILLNYLSFPWASLFHIPRLLTYKYDKIFIYQLSPILMAISGVIIGRLKRIETTMYVLDLWPENLFSVLDIQQPLLRRLITIVSYWHYRHVDKLIVLSEQMKVRIIQITGASPDRVIVLPQACEKIYEETSRDVELVERFEGGFNILYAGNISPAQSFETMIDAAKLLRDSGLHDMRWIIVGDGMSRKNEQTAVHAAGLDQWFHFEGHHPIDDIPAYTDVADVLVGCLVKSALLEATIPAKVMSYFAAGKPMVVSMDGEVQKLVNETVQCGYASPTGNAVALAENLRKVYALSPKERATMGQRARNHHFKYFQRNIILGKLYDFVFKQ